MKRVLAGVTLALLFAALFATPAPPRVSAEVSGPCTVTVNGRDIGPLSASSKDDAVKVEKGDTLTVVMTSSDATGFDSHKIELELSGLRIPLQDEKDGGDTQWTGSADVNDYAKYGVGLYKVVGEGKLIDGTSCTGAVLIEVQGTALTSVAGITAAAAFLLGLALLLGSSIGGLRRYDAMGKSVEEWAGTMVKRINAGETLGPGELIVGLRDIAKPRPPITLWMLTMLPLFVFIGAIPAGAAPSASGGGRSIGPLNLPRIPFRPGVSVIGSVGGMIATEAVVVLFQQFAISPLTQSNTLLGLAAGLALAVVFTTVVKLWGTRHANDAIAAAEVRFNEALAQVRREAGLPPVAPTTEMTSATEPPVMPPPSPPTDTGGVGEP
ncbi:MAG: hypothetical protein ABI559_03925 [Chloroflexota bacterium]